MRRQEAELEVVDRNTYYSSGVLINDGNHGIHSTKLGSEVYSTVLYLAQMDAPEDKSSHKAEAKSYTIADQMHHVQLQ